MFLTRRITHERAVNWGRGLGRFASKLPWRERKVLRRNLVLALGPDIDDADREHIEKGVFESLLMLAFEAGQSSNWTREDYLCKFEIADAKHAEDALAHGRGVIFVSGHYGNWELLHPAYSCFSGIAPAVVSRDVTNPALNEKLAEFRGRMGSHIFSTDQSAVRYLKLLRKGGALAIMVDQDSKRVRCEFVRFFGRPASTPIGPGFLAKKCGAPIVPVFLRRMTDDPTRHRMKFYPPIFPDSDLDEETDAWRMIQDVTECLEEEIREAPEQWVWIHDRWKRQPRQGELDLLEQRLNERKQHA
jgi:KDO2-lipid IV(A) lauroyltransferase